VAGGSSACNHERESRDDLAVAAFGLTVAVELCDRCPQRRPTVAFSPLGPISANERRYVSMSTFAPPAHASNADLVRWAFEKLNAHDVAPLRQLWTDETVERFPDRTCRGAAEIAGYFEEAFVAIPDFHMETVAIVEQGEDVFVHWHLTGVHRGPLLGIQPTGRKLSVDGVDHFVLRDGVVVSNFVVFDQMQYARQIGLMPADGSTADKSLKAAFNARTKLMAKLRRSTT
jgi:predicted ester cyclase